MTLADDLKALEGATPRTFDRWLKLHPEDAELVLGYLCNQTIPVDSLQRVLRANGIPITGETIKAYRESRS